MGLVVGEASSSLKAVDKVQLPEEVPEGQVELTVTYSSNINSTKDLINSAHGSAKHLKFSTDTFIAQKRKDKLLED